MLGWTADTPVSRGRNPGCCSARQLRKLRPSRQPVHLATTSHDDDVTSGNHRTQRDVDQHRDRTLTVDGRARHELGAEYFLQRLVR
jgi:hypothetical protein